MKEAFEKISVVVPVYNVEKYIERCIDSILSQTYKNLQIILVDDGATDNSGDICDRYAKEYSNVQVIHKQNGGLSDARNIGIDHAEGNYISFIDSDDYVLPNFIETLYKLCIENETALSMCYFQRVYNDKHITSINEYENNIYTSRQMLLDIYSGDKYTNNIVTWNKLYKKELFNNIRFPFGKIHEDEGTTYKIFSMVDKVAVTTKLLYCYLYTQNSITTKGFNIKSLDAIELIEERLGFFKDKLDNELYIKTFDKLQNMLRDYCMKSIFFIEDYKGIQQMLLSKARKYFWLSMKNSESNLKNKIGNIIFCLSPKIYFNMKRKEYNERFNKKNESISKEIINNNQV